MKKDDMLPFKGMIGIDIPFENGYSISLLKWESTPTKYGAFSQVWVFDPAGHKICYIDPAEAEELFHKYHSFDTVVPASLTWEWKSADALEVVVNNGDLKVEVTTAQSFIGRALNMILKTPLRGLLKNKGKTETDMAYCHQSDILHFVTAAKLYTGKSGSAALQKGKQSVISVGTHYLEDYR